MRGHEKLSIRQQCELLEVSLSSFYARPQPVSAEDEKLQALIDEIYTEHPYYGTRRMVVTLAAMGYRVGRSRVRRLMLLMGLVAIIPKRKTTKVAPGHTKYPYLLRGLAITRPNQVWCTDITYIRLAHGWAYMVAIMDWNSRCVLAWRLSNTMNEDFCLEALAEALKKHGAPEIFNSDQGAQFTGEAFTGMLAAHGVRISRDGRGRCMDNIFIERLWWSLKHEEVYLNAYADLKEARGRIGEWVRFYNHERPHSSLAYQTPARRYGAAA